MKKNKPHVIKKKMGCGIAGCTDGKRIVNVGDGYAWSAEEPCPTCDPPGAIRQAEIMKEVNRRHGLFGGFLSNH